MQAEAHTAYTQWLSSEPWDLFLTMTDPGLSHPEAMYKRTRYAMNQINKSLYGKHFYKKGLGIEHVIGLERQKRGSVHSHTLIRLPHHNVKDRNEFPLGYWHARINKLGGFAKLELPNDSINTVDYVTKYVCKGGEIYLSETFIPSAPKAYSHTLFGAVH
jgi:hypothetical protein